MTQTYFGIGGILPNGQTGIFEFFNDSVAAFEAVSTINLAGGCAKVFLTTNKEKIASEIIQNLQKMIKHFTELPTEEDKPSDESAHPN